jgi:hypothetical protein
LLVEEALNDLKFGELVPALGCTHLTRNSIAFIHCQYLLPAFEERHFSQQWDCVALSTHWVTNERELLVYYGGDGIVLLPLTGILYFGGIVVELCVSRHRRNPWRYYLGHAGQ